MAEIRLIERAALPNQQSVVETLEGLLAHAKSGDISAIAVAVLHRNGTAHCEFSDSDNPLALMGAIGMLEHWWFAIIKAKMES